MNWEIINYPCVLRYIYIYIIRVDDGCRYFVVAFSVALLYGVLTGLISAHSIYKPAPATKILLLLAFSDSVSLSLSLSLVKYLSITFLMIS